MPCPRDVQLPKVEDRSKRDLDVLLAMLVRADIGFVLNQTGPVTTVALIMEPVPPMRAPRPVFRFTKVGGAMRGFGLEDVTDL